MIAHPHHALSRPGRDHPETPAIGLNEAHAGLAFDEPGEVIVGCHQLGRYEDGMRLTVEVV